MVSWVVTVRGWPKRDIFYSWSLRLIGVVT
jgi:hypothetical protein